MKYAIKYLKIRLTEDIDLLIPKKLVKGDVQDGEYFSTDQEIFTYITNPTLDGKYIIGDASTIDEIRVKFELPESTFSKEETLDYYFMEKCEHISLIKDGNRTCINIVDLFHDGEKKLYKHTLENGLYLNKKIIDTLLDVDNIETLKNIIREHSDKLESFEDFRKEKGVEKILVKDGHIAQIDKKEVIQNPISSPNINLNQSSASDIYSKEFTVTGLYEYLKTCIIGHDKELKDISTILYLNYKSNPIYGTESILIPGPTGTGKTATFNCAAEYFNVPFKNINTCNLVPEGIEGTTMEDEFATLLDMCGGDNSKAEKAIIVFDEFDKLGEAKLDIKKDLIYIFLKALEGGNFPINRQLKQTRTFNTLMSSKIALGTFTEAFKRVNTIGFHSNETEEEIFDEKLLVKKGYFTNELLSRFQHFIPYQELTDEDKKRIILESRLSTYLMKKDRFRNQFGIEITGDEEFAIGVLEALKQNDKSVRDINNIISKALLDVEYDILESPGKYKVLKLTRDTVSSKNYDLKSE
jgi:hypothetical protein